MNNPSPFLKEFRLVIRLAPLLA